MQPPAHWAYALVPPVPDDLPEDLKVSFPVQVPWPRVQVPRSSVPVLALADAAGQARLWFSAGASLDLIGARLNQRCPREPRWTRAAVRKLLMQTKRAA